MSAENTQTSFPTFPGDERYEEILSRIQHLKELFSLGQEVLPLLEELFMFFNDMTPLLGHVSDQTLVNQGIIPNIAYILEGAINQMTDSTYQIMQEASDMQNRVNAIVTPGSMADKNPDILKDELRKLQDQTNSIINALQFHDIVSQKLIHVKKVLSQAQSKLISLFACINNLNVTEETKRYLMQSLGVEPEEIDHILTSFIVDNGNLTADHEYASGVGSSYTHKPDLTQEDIDKLFE